MALESTTTDPVATPPEADEAEAQAKEQGADEGQQNEQTAADEQGEDTSQASDSEETEPAESADEAVEADNSDETELKDWAEKKGLPLDDPLKIAKMYRESEKQLGKKGQQEGQLKKAVDSANTESGVEANQALENRIAALEFYLEHPDAKPFESEMVKILEEKPWLAGDLETVLDAAKGRSSTEAQTLAAERKAGRAEALAQAEKAGRAAQPRASATNAAKAGSSRITPENVNQIVGQHMGDTEWYEKNRPAIDAALAA